MQVFGLCHIGRIRKNNEDCLGMELPAGAQRRGASPGRRLGID